MRFEVVKPFVELRIDYEGPSSCLPTPSEMADPRQALTTNPHTDCAVHLVYRGTSAMFGGEPDQPNETPRRGVRPGHYEQLGAASGSIEVGDERWDLDGFGLRDHSWGPRYWQAPWYYRWLTGNVGADFGFMGSRVAGVTGPARAAASCGMGAPYISAATSSSARPGRATPTTTGTSRPS